MEDATGFKSVLDTIGPQRRGVHLESCARVYRSCGHPSEFDMVPNANAAHSTGIPDDVWTFVVTEPGAQVRIHIDPRDDAAPGYRRRSAQARHSSSAQSA